MFTEMFDDVNKESIGDINQLINIIITVANKSVPIKHYTNKKNLQQKI